MTKVALSVSNISKKFEGHDALKSVSFEVEEGAIFGLLGHNGAGKTTLIRMLTQITAPDEGEIILYNQAISRDTINRVGYLPEERGLYKKMRVAEQLHYFASLRGIPKQVATPAISQWLERMDLLKWEKKTLHDLSKGMQQKVQFITAVLHDPDFIILDEPFSGFDPINTELLKKEIIRLNSIGKTILLSTHQMESVEELCTGIAMINHGECIYKGSVENLKSQYEENTWQIAGYGELPDNLQTQILKKQQKDQLITCSIHFDHDVDVATIVEMTGPSFQLNSVKKLDPELRAVFLKLVKSKSNV